MTQTVYNWEDGAESSIGIITHWRGAWLTSVNYIKNEGVQYNGSTYVCILDHLSGSNTAPGVGADWSNYWNLVAQKGDKGDNGSNSTVTAGTTTTGNPGTNASVENAGTNSDAIFNFTIPRGNPGIDGIFAVSVSFVGNDMVFVMSDSSTITLTGAKTTLKGDKGNKGDTGASIISASFIGNDLVFTKDDSTTATLTNAKISLKGDKGDQGIPGLIQALTAGAGIHIDSTNPANPIIVNTFDTLAELGDDSAHRTVTDAEKSTWNAKQNSIGYTPANDSNVVHKTGTESIGGDKTFTDGVAFSKGSINYGAYSPFPTGLGTYVASYVSPTYGARVLAYDGLAYQDLKIGKLISGTTFQLALNADGTSVFGGSLTASNLTGSNTGDETTATIKTKLGNASTSTDGYLTSANWNTFNNKQNALGYTPVTNARTISTTSPLSGGGDLTTDRTISINQAGSASNGYLSSTDWNTFNNKQAYLGFTPENSSNKNTANGYAGLDANSKINPSQLPAIAVTDTFVVASQSAMLALTAQTGDVAVRTDVSKSFILKGTDPATLTDWQELLTPTSGVASVFGRTGVVTAQSGDYTADQITETATRVFVTPAQKTVLSNTSNTNTGDETTATIKSKLGVASTSVDGYLSSTDWNTFNGKAPLVSPSFTTPILGVASATSIKLSGSTIISSSATSGIALYNTADEVTNTEKASIYWSSNKLNIATSVTGTGTNRGILFNIGGARTFEMLYGAGTSGGFIFTGGTGTANANHTGFRGTFSTSSGINSIIDPQITTTQSGTAGYTIYGADVTETSTGSGEKNLANWKVGGVSKFKVDNTGIVTMANVGNTAGNTVSVDGTQTLSNKRRTPRVYATTSLATLTPEIASYDIFHLTAQAAALTIANHSTSTPADGELMEIRILDNGTARAISFGTNYVAKAGVALPTTTVVSKNMTLLFEWNANLSKFNLMAVGSES